MKSFLMELFFVSPSEKKKKNFWNFCVDFFLSVIKKHDVFVWRKKKDEQKKFSNVFSWHNVFVLWFDRVKL